MQARHKYRDAYLDTPARNHIVQWNTVAAKAIIVVCNIRRKLTRHLKRVNHDRGTDLK